MALMHIVLWPLDRFFLFQSDSKNLDPSCKMDSDFGTVLQCKTPCYNRINKVSKHIEPK